MEIISLEDARAKALIHYFTGKPCKRGGIGKRLTVNKTCLCELCTERRKGVLAKYRDANKAALDAEKADWYRKNATRVLAKQKANSDHIKVVQSKRREKNKDAIAKYASEYYQKNKEKRKAYRLAERHRYAAHCSRRRADMRNRVPSWHGELDAFVEEQAAELVLLRKKSTGIKWHVDHMIPVRSKIASGLHCHNNFQVIPAKLNEKKGNRMWLTEPLEWIKHV